MNLQLVQEENTSLKEALSQEGHETNLAQQKVEEMEKKISGVFQAIPDNAELEEAYVEENMRRIAQALVQYKENIKELEERAIPTTPPVVQEQRDQDVTTTIEKIVFNIHRVEELLEKSDQL
jgi:hypothetical protein